MHKQQHITIKMIVRSITIHNKESANAGELEFRLISSDVTSMAVFVTFSISEDVDVLISGLVVGLMVGSGLFVLMTVTDGEDVG